jgi:hypothetical protein
VEVSPTASLQRTRIPSVPRVTQDLPRVHHADAGWLARYPAIEKRAGDQWTTELTPLAHDRRALSDSGAIGPFVYRVGDGYWRGQSDRALLDGFQERMSANLSRAALSEATRELGLEALREGGLHPAERELLSFLHSEEGAKVNLRYHSRLGPNGNRASWFPRDGVYVVEFGPDPVGRTRWQILRHELSHTMDGVTDLAFRALGRRSPIHNYAGTAESIACPPPHRLLFQEYRANLFATLGDFDQALHLTRIAYPSPYFPSGYVVPSGVDLEALPSRRVYRLAQALTAEQREQVVVSRDMLERLAPPVEAE